MQQGACDFGLLIVSELIVSDRNCALFVAVSRIHSLGDTPDEYRILFEVLVVSRVHLDAAVEDAAVEDTARP